MLQGDPGLTPAGRAWLDFLLGALGGHPSQQQGATLANLPVRSLTLLATRHAAVDSLDIWFRTSMLTLPARASKPPMQMLRACVLWIVRLQQDCASNITSPSASLTLCENLCTA